MKIKIELIDADDFSRCILCTSENDVKEIKLRRIDVDNHEHSQSIKLCQKCRINLKSVL